MKFCIKMITPLALVTVMLVSACSESKTKTEETTEISTMDSTSKMVEENIDKLEDQTKKVEESLEKLDKEFDTTK